MIRTRPRSSNGPSVPPATLAKLVATTAGGVLPSMGQTPSCEWVDDPSCSELARVDPPRRGLGRAPSYQR